MLEVRYFAGARAAAGTSAETIEVGTVQGRDGGDGQAASLDDLIAVLAERHGERLALVLKAASFLVDGLACHDRRAALPAGATVDVLPPFAGG